MPVSYKKMNIHIIFFQCKKINKYILDTCECVIQIVLQFATIIQIIVQHISFQYCSDFFFLPIIISNRILLNQSILCRNLMPEILKLIK